jgi:hypothetical protein
MIILIKKARKNIAGVPPSIVRVISILFYTTKTIPAKILKWEWDWKNILDIYV